MFEWKIEELKLYHQKGEIYDCEHTVSREDKIASVDGYFYDKWDSGDCCLYGYWKIK